MGLAVETGPSLVPIDSAESYAQRGFMTTRLDDLVSWARTGSLVADDLWPGLLRGRDDARGSVAL